MEHDENEDAHEIAYIRSLLKELAILAGSKSLPMLCYLIEMAFLEANSTATVEERSQNSSEG